MATEIDKGEEEKENGETIEEFADDPERCSPILVALQFSIHK